MTVPRAACDGVGIDRSDSDELMANRAGVRTSANRANEMPKGIRDLALSWIIIILMVFLSNVRCAPTASKKSE